MNYDKRKRGRPKKMKNPYNKASQEAEYLSYEHGYNSMDMLNDCPYDPKDPDARQAYSAWITGFKSNKSRPKVVKNVAPEAENSQSEATLEPTLGTGEVTLEMLSTAVLEAELKKRKIKDLEQLLQQEAKLNKALEEIKAKVARLKILMGD